MKRAFALLGCAAIAACSSDGPPSPELHVGGTSSCAEDDVGGCLNTGVKTVTVSGVHVIYKQAKGEPVVALQVLIDGGDRSGEQLWAEALALELLDQEGSRSLGLTEWPRRIESIGASVSAGMGTGYGSVSAVAPVTYWDDLWSLVASALDDPADDDYVLDFLKERTQKSYDTERDEPATAARIAALSALYRGHLYNRFRETRADAQTVSTSDVAKAWTGMLTKERLWIVVVGDVDFRDVAAKVANAFGGLPAREKSAFAGPPAPPPPPTLATASVLDYPDAPNWQITGYFFGPDATATDYPAFTIGAELLNERLFTEIRLARGLAYSVSMGAGFNNPSTGSLNLATVAPLDALPVVRRTITDFIDNPVAADELDAARGVVRAALLSNNRTPGEIAGTLGEYQLMTGDRLNLDRYLDALRSVSEADARRVIAQYLPTMSVAAAGPTNAVSEAKLLAILPGTSADAGAPPDAGRSADAGPD